jgi:uncharacterized protein (DUF2236 family)
MPSSTRRSENAEKVSEEVSEEEQPHEALLARREHADFETCQAYVRAHAAGEVEGLFGPESVTWTMYREPSTLLFGLPAVLLQLAHPAVAAGVDTHSTFRTDVPGRARQTTTALYRVVFGALDEVLALGAGLYAIHARVRGRIEAPDARADGQAYRANDQRLLRWVAATTTICARAAFEAFVRPLSSAEAPRWYTEVTLASVAVGVRLEQQPEGPEAFARWYEDVLGSGELAVGQRARSLAGVLLRSPLAGGSLGATLAAGLLPEQVRAGYGLPWGRWEQRAFRTAAAGLRGSARVGAPFRYVVAWHEAEARLARARGGGCGSWSRWVADQAGRSALPTSLGHGGARRASATEDGNSQANGSDRQLCEKFP